MTWMTPFDAITSGVTTRAVARPLIDGLRNETVVRETRIRSLIPRELTPFDVASRAALTELAH